MKRLVVILVCALSCSAGVPPAWSAASSRSIDAGNKVCPVSGEAVDGKHFAEHGGKRYGFCCGDCIRDFKKDPEKYLASLSLAAPAGHEEHPHGHDHAHEHPGDAA